MCYFTLPLSSLHPLPCPGAPEAPEAPIRPPFSPIFIFYLPAKRSRATTIQFTWNPPWSRTSIFTSASKVHLQQCRFPLMQFSFENHFLRLWSSRLAGWQRAFGECFLFNHKAGDCVCVSECNCVFVFSPASWTHYRRRPAQPALLGRGEPRARKITAFLLSATPTRWRPE